MNDTKPTEGGRLSLAAASKFAERWKDVTSEKQFDQQFWHDFFKDICGIEDLRESGIEFQKKVISSKKGTQNYIDVFWKDVFLVEHKSAGKDLDAAESQARDYLVSLPPALRPPSLIISDFARFRIVDVLLGNKIEFPLEELPANLTRIEALIALNSRKATEVQVEADQKAAQLMADLYVELKNFKYEGHVASVFMVRILFCLFADDTRMWKTDSFANLVRDTNPLGTDLGPRLATLFEILDTPKELRKGPQDPLLEDFPYVNGGIFSERLETVNFNGAMRNALMNACMYDWSSINPTIFGALFQDIKSKDERRANGEHYTTEENIEKIIGPLFIDDLHLKLEAAWDSQSKLKALQLELGRIQILDPACGCGNFLITAYKRLRQMELDIIVRLKQLDGTRGQTSLFDVSEDLFVSLEQLHGIEYVDWSSEIARIAVYLTDHQENMKLETVLGVAANRFPLTHSANIIQGNALDLDWSEVCQLDKWTFIIGNPPFLGARLQTEEQKQDQARIWGGITGSGTTDYVTNWFILAARHVDKTGCSAALVSTNSITQGEQPALLWSILKDLNVEISFAHRSFAWDNDASGSAAVHCVVIGFTQKSVSKSKHLWDYEDLDGAPVKRAVSKINAYLIEGDSILIKAQKKPIVSGIPLMKSGNKPRDGGYLSSISSEEADSIRASDPIAAKYLRPLVGSAELLNGMDSRYCLWLVDANPSDLKSSRQLSERIQRVFEERSAATSSKGAAASRPSLFESITQPSQTFIAVPSVSSEKRKYIPVEFLRPDIIVNNAVFVVESSDYFIYTVLQSRVFRVWVETVSSRLKSDYQISASSVYNTFPFPSLQGSSMVVLNELGAALKESREKFAKIPLGELYDPMVMPQAILGIHKKIDNVLLKSFGLRVSATDAEILQTLFTEFVKLTSAA